MTRYSFFLTVLLLIALPARAQHVTAAHGDWNNGATWADNAVPEPNSTVTIDHNVQVTGKVNEVSEILVNGVLDLGTMEVTVKGAVRLGPNGRITNSEGINGGRIKALYELVPAKFPSVLIDVSIESADGKSKKLYVNFIPQNMRPNVGDYPNLFVGNWIIFLDGSGKFSENAVLVTFNNVAASDSVVFYDYYGLSQPLLPVEHRREQDGRSSVLLHDPFVFYSLQYEITKTSTATETEGLPEAFALEQNYPNPFNSTTT